MKYEVRVYSVKEGWKIMARHKETGQLHETSILRIIQLAAQAGASLK